MDSDDRKSMIKSVVKSLKLDEKSTRFPKPEVLSSLFSLADNEGANIRETQENAYPYLSNHLDAILEVHDQYVARKQETNSMDFDDLLLNVVRLFQEQEHLRACTVPASSIFWWMSTRTPITSRAASSTCWPGNTAS